jgi:hypothetical protein
MATTTNYGWTTPDDTALVKDGAAAIRTLGTSVDTTTKALNPSTTLGDIEYRSSTANTNTRLGIGSSGQVLTVAAGVPSWAAGFANPLTTTGDTIYSSSGSTPARLGIGTAGQILKVNSGATAPEWGAAPTAGANWSLLNAGGTALSGSSTVTISGISGQDKLMLLIRNAGNTSQSGISLRVNGDSGNNYFAYGGILDTYSSYNVNYINDQKNTLGSGSSEITFGQGSTAVGSTDGSGYLQLSGCNASGSKIFTMVGAFNAADGTGNTARFVGGWYDSSSTISSVSITSSANFSIGNLYLYGSA